MFFQSDGPFDVRPLCYEAKSQAPSVCQSSVRSSSLGDRLTFFRLDSSGCLCFSPVQSDSASIAENTGTLVPSIFGGTHVAAESLVQQSPGTSSDIPRALPQRQDLLLQRGALHKSPDIFYLHVWPLSGRLSESKHFLKELPLLSSSRRGSTRGLRGQMEVYRIWYVRRKINPIDPSSRFSYFSFRRKETLG